MPRSRTATESTEEHRARMAQIVKEYNDAPRGQGVAVAKKYGLSIPLIVYWRNVLMPEATHRTGGRAPRRRAYPQEYKQRIGAEARQGHLSAAEIARREGLHMSLVSQWKRGKDLGQSAHPQYSTEYKLGLVAEVTGGASIAGTARREGIAITTLREWIRGEHLGEAVAHVPAATPKGRPRDVVAVTNAAVQKLNEASAHTKTGAFIREALVRLRSIGVDVESIQVQGNSCTVSYTTKETFDL